MLRKLHCFNVHRPSSKLAQQCRNLLDLAKPVEVYRNLHKDCWSVRQNRLVRFHTDYICLTDAKFVVSKAGQLRVLKSGHKNVHAFVKGLLCNPREQWANRLPYSYDEITYNPYKYDSFVFADNKNPVFHAKFVDMDAGSCAGPQVMVQFAA